jgi:thiol:disulfide interchange protein
MMEYVVQEDFRMVKSLAKVRGVASAAVLGALLGAGCVTASAQLPPGPIVKKHIYPDITSAQADIQAAVDKAHHEHKRVILDFGGDWCPDCQVLDYYFHQSPNQELLDKYFVKVNVNIGHMDANLDVAHKYHVPIHGVPA